MSALPVPQEPDDERRDPLIAVLGALIHECYGTARDRGWWFAKSIESRGAECVALMHSECTEVLQAMRAGRWTARARPATSKEIEQQGVGTIVEEGVLEESADLLIRLCDFLGAGEHEGRWTVAQFADALLAKMVANRRHDGPGHGKRF